MAISQQDRIPVFVAVARIFDLVIAGVYLEAWVLTAMMTAPFTTGEMSRRIERDDRVHIEYMPTQVVTGFISWTLHKISIRGRIAARRAVAGLLKYPTVWVETRQLKTPSRNLHSTHRRPRLHHPNVQSPGWELH